MYETENCGGPSVDARYDPRNGRQTAPPVGRILAGGNGQAPTPANQILGSAGANAGRLEHIHNLIGELEERLRPVLRSPGPEATGTKDGISTSPLLEFLEQQARSLDGISMRLTSLCQRVDL